MTTMRQGRAIDDAGHPIPGAQVFLVDSRMRLRGTSAPTGAEGTFAVQAAEPGLQILLAHPDFFRTAGPVPADESTVVSFEMRRRPSSRKTQLRQAPGSRVAFVERDTKGLVVVYETRTDDRGGAAVGVDPSCTVRLLPFAEKDGALRRLTEAMEIVDFPPLETLAEDLRYKEAKVVRETARETTLAVGGDLQLRFFFLPRTFEDAVAFAPLLDAYDGLRDVAFQGVHANIVPVVRAGVTCGVGYVAHRVPGESLEDLVKKNGPIADAECLRMHRDLDPAVAALEAKGIVHGNIAPRFVYCGAESWQIAPPCPAVPAGWRFARDHRIHDGLPGGDRFGLGATLHYAATGREPQFEPPQGGSPSVGAMDTLRGPFKPTGKGIDAALKSLLQ